MLQVAIRLSQFGQIWDSHFAIRITSVSQSGQYSTVYFSTVFIIWFLYPPLAFLMPPKDNSYLALIVLHDL
jgi:hypothetical protein